MTQITDDMTIEQLRELMDFIKNGDSTHEDVVDAVHTLLKRPENVFYREIGHGRGM